MRLVIRTAIAATLAATARAQLTVKDARVRETVDVKAPARPLNSGAAPAMHGGHKH